MEMHFLRWLVLWLVGCVFCGCSEKVEKEEKKAVVEEEVDPFSGNKAGVVEQVAEVVEVDPVEAIIAEKLNRMIIPRLDFEDRTLEEAIDFIRLRTSEIHDGDSDPTKRGMGFVIRWPKGISKSVVNAESPAELVGDEEFTTRIPELRVRNVSFAAALRYICLMTDMRCEVDQCLVLSPRNPNAAWNAVGAVLEESCDTKVISKKLRQIRLLHVDFENTSIYEAIDFLRLRSAENDVMELDPGKKGTNFVIYVPKEMEVPVINKLEMQDSSVEEVLKEICAKTGMRYELDPYSVILVPKDLR